MFYDKSSSQSEQTTEENQRLLAMNSELKEEVQEMAQASLALQVNLFRIWLLCLLVSSLHVWHLSPQEKLSKEQQLLDEQQQEMAALREQLSSLQVWGQPLAKGSAIHSLIVVCVFYLGNLGTCLYDSTCMLCFLYSTHSHVMYCCIIATMFTLQHSC